jgi:hypothetical protein
MASLTYSYARWFPFVIVLIEAFGLDIDVASLAPTSICLDLNGIQVQQVGYLAFTK